MVLEGILDKDLKYENYAPEAGAPNEGAPVSGGLDYVNREACVNGSEDVFVYLCNHISQTTDALRKDIDRRKANMLTIMSFCFLGEVAFVASNYDPLTRNIAALVLATVSLVLWAGAYGTALIVNKGDGYHIVPGRMEGLSFLPYPDEVQEFEASDADPFNADIELAKRALARFDREKYRTVNDESVVEVYNEVIRGNVDLESFNKNAWIAELSQMLRGQKKHYSDTMRFYKVLQVLFVISIVSMIASMLVLWYVQFAFNIAVL